MDDKASETKVQLFATDIDEDAIGGDRVEDRSPLLLEIRSKPR